MEIKKSDKVNLENKRATWFLLGLIFVLSVVFVSMEYTSHDASLDDSDEQLDDVAQDMEMLPALDTKDMIAAAPVASSPTASDKLKPVDQPTKLEKLNQINDMRMATAANGTASSADNKDDADNTTALSPVAVDEDDNPLNFRIVEQLPEFPGGMVEFMKWLTKNIKYPILAQHRKIEGKVVVSFIINKDGTIANEKIDQSVDPFLDREAMRVIRMMPKWKPGLENNKPCRTMFAIPIVFKL